MSSGELIPVECFGSLCLSVSLSLYLAIVVSPVECFWFGVEGFVFMLRAFGFGLGGFASCSAVLVWSWEVCFSG